VIGYSPSINPKGKKEKKTPTEDRPLECHHDENLHPFFFAGFDKKPSGNLAYLRELYSSDSRIYVFLAFFLLNRHCCNLSLVQGTIQQSREPAEHRPAWKALHPRPFVPPMITDFQPPRSYSPFTPLQQPYSPCNAFPHSSVQVCHPNRN